MLRLETPQKSPRKLLLTPLIDAIFILVIFFMLASRFSSMAELPLNISGQSTGDGKPFILLSVSETELRLNGLPTSLETLSETLEAKKKTQDFELVLQLQKTASVQRLVDVLQVLRTIEGLNYALSTGSEGALQ
jgi:biopolymer transport protein ExbD